jgi:hypothetical protein
MKIIKVNFASHFLFPPFVISEVLYESCSLTESVEEVNAGTLSGLFELVLAGIRSAAELSPSCSPELGSFNVNSTVGEDAFELNVRVILREEHIRRDLHSRVFDRLRAVLYCAADFEKCEFSESYTDDTQEGGSK